jgi:hypothetical protein
LAFNLGRKLKESGEKAFPGRGAGIVGSFYASEIYDRCIFKKPKTAIRRHSLL